MELTLLDALLAPGYLVVVLATLLIVVLCVLLHYEVSMALSRRMERSTRSQRHHRPTVPGFRLSLGDQLHHPGLWRYGAHRPHPLRNGHRGLDRLHADHLVGISDVFGNAEALAHQPQRLGCSG